MPISYTYRLLKGASWGIAITLRGEVQTGAVLPSNAVQITEAIWLQIDVGWRPSEEELEFLKLGMNLVARNVEKSYRGRTPILVRLTGLHYNPTDYQPEGLASAVAEWTAQLCGFPKPEISAAYSQAQRRYVFDFPPTRTDRAIVSVGGGTRIDITAPPDTWVAESVLAVLRHFWDDALFEATGSIERKPLRDRDVLIRGATFKDFSIILPSIGLSAAEGVPTTAPRNRVLRFLFQNCPTSATEPQQLTLICDERTEDIERLRLSLEKTLWANEMAA